MKCDKFGVTDTLLFLACVSIVFCLLLFFFGPDRWIGTSRHAPGLHLLCAFVERYFQTTANSPIRGITHTSLLLCFLFPFSLSVLYRILAFEHDDGVCVVLHLAV